MSKSDTKTQQPTIRQHQENRTSSQSLRTQKRLMTRFQTTTKKAFEFARKWATCLALFTTISLGCVAEKESLHETDHELPTHWPQNMEDAAQKIEQRLGQLEIKESLKATRGELLDLIEWAPEVAADTDLPELDWVPIFELSETLRRHLSASDISLNDCRDDIERFIVLLRESHAKLPNTNTTKEDNQ